MITALIITFILGYLLIAFEHTIKINKAAVALLTGVICWVLLGTGHAEGHDHLHEALGHHLSAIAEILFFLLGAMTIVELIDAHEGFEVITTRITTTSKRKLVWIIAILSFFLSAALDNLTTTIVMISLVRKLIADRNERFVFAGLIVIAANAGGAWSPIGDVTSTMLWIGGQVSTMGLITYLILPSVVCLLVPLLVFTLLVKGNAQRPRADAGKGSTMRDRNIVFISGLLSLIGVPVFKVLTGLPPYMGVLLGVAVLWIITELLHKAKNDEERKSFSVAHALQRIDTPSMLFFLGILLAISALETSPVLSSLSEFIAGLTDSKAAIAISTGVASAVVDNVPLVAAVQSMYTYPMDDYFWLFTAFTSGTGGSMLIIGSAAGVTAMGMENISFFRYAARMGWLAALGFLAGSGVFMLQSYLF